VSPDNGVLGGGTRVVITGTNFFGVSGAAAVKFGNANAASYTLDSHTQITAFTPAGLESTVNVVVTAVDGTATLQQAFSYSPTAFETQASGRIFFVPGRAEIRSSEYPELKSILAAASGKANILITVTSRRSSSTKATLGAARLTETMRLLELIGFDSKKAIYTRFNTRSNKGSPNIKKNNRVIIRVSWTN
jgi:hypothetical protein